MMIQYVLEPGMAQPVFGSILDERKHLQAVLSDVVIDV